MSESREILDGARTSHEWKRESPNVCILPVGAFEQHSRHLPLATDNILADYFGRFLAEEIGAALLPTLAFATSLEHSGFAGTVSLRPETLMQVIRDIADEVEAQGFRTLIVLNIHGGNFAVAPVVRDINRKDRPLKLLHVHPPALRPTRDADGQPIFKSVAAGNLDIHAGEVETSIMLAIAPELVGDDRADMKPVNGFIQSDLNTFGVGHVAPEGAFGAPSLGTREKGETVLKGLKENLLQHVHERLKWLEESRKYGHNNSRSTERKAK